MPDIPRVNPSNANNTTPQQTIGTPTEGIRGPTTGRIIALRVTINQPPPTDLPFEERERGIGPIQGPGGTFNNLSAREFQNLMGGPPGGRH